MGKIIISKNNPILTNIYTRIVIHFISLIHFIFFSSKCLLKNLSKLAIYHLVNAAIVCHIIVEIYYFIYLELCQKRMTFFFFFNIWSTQYFNVNYSYPCLLLNTIIVLSMDRKGCLSKDLMFRCFLIINFQVHWK